MGLFYFIFYFWLFDVLQGVGRYVFEYLMVDLVLLVEYFEVEIVVTAVFLCSHLQFIDHVEVRDHSSYLTNALLSRHLLLYRLYLLPQVLHLAQIRNITILISKLSNQEIELPLGLHFLFGFAIRLVLFGDNSQLLLEGYDGIIAVIADVLSAYVFENEVTGFAFLDEGICFVDHLNDNYNNL